jgi:hypothetical protein
MIEAGTNPTSCARCHGTAFCESCHNLQKVANLSAPFTGERNPHPAGWNEGSAHGKAARRNIVTCASCHASNADQVCVMCHRVGGIGGNPHPPGFLKRNDLGDTTKKLCRACHT